MSIKTISINRHKFWPLLFVLGILIGGSSVAIGQQGNPPPRDVWFFFGINGGQAQGWKLPCTVEEWPDECTRDKWEAVYLTIEVDNPATPQNPDWVGDTKGTMPDFNAFWITTGDYWVPGGYSITISGEVESGEIVSRTLVVHDILVDVDNQLVNGHASLGSWNNEVCVELEQCWNWPCTQVEGDGFWSLDLATECISALDESGQPTPFPVTQIVAHQWDDVGNETDLPWPGPNGASANGTLKSVRCEGFDTPLTTYPVKVRKNRTLPLKAELYNAAGSLIKNADVISPPVISVMFNSGDGDGAVDVTDGTLAAGQGDDGNQFVYTDEGIWRFNLRTRNYSAPGMYSITMQSGNNDEYQIEFVSTCITQFAIE